MNLTHNTKVTFNVTLDLNEEEARALEAITVYGYKRFLEFFYVHMGKAYLQPYESGLVSLFDTIKNKLSPELKKVKDVKNMLSKVCK